jgi:hypothetical protein
MALAQAPLVGSGSVALGPNTCFSGYVGLALGLVLGSAGLPLALRLWFWPWLWLSCLLL